MYTKLASAVGRRQPIRDEPEQYSFELVKYDKDDRSESGANAPYDCRTSEHTSGVRALPIEQLLFLLAAAVFAASSALFCDNPPMNTEALPVPRSGAYPRDARGCGDCAQDVPQLVQ